MRITDDSEFVPFTPRTTLTGLDMRAIPLSACIRCDGLEPYYRKLKRTGQGGYTATGIFLYTIRGDKP